MVATAARVETRLAGYDPDAWINKEEACTDNSVIVKS